MSASDLIFRTTSNNTTVYGPLLVSGTDVEIEVTNYGTEDLDGLGLYIRPSTSVGDVDNPANYPPETDYQDLLTWGSRTDAGLAASGGVVLGLASGTYYVTRTAGSTYQNRILVPELAAGATLVFNVKLETPPSYTARRFFVDLLVE